MDRLLGSEPAAARLRSTLLTDRAALDPHRAAWDALVDACSSPFCSFDWLAAWWDHARPRGATLAVVLVHDARDELVGLAPGFCDRGTARVVHWRPLGARTFQRTQPLALPGHERGTAAAVVQALDALRPRPLILSLEGSPPSPWPALLQDAWPRSSRAPRVLSLATATALTLDLAPGYDAWFASKTSHFRQRLRKADKTAAAAGAAFRLADAASAAADVEGFLRVHIGRWDGRGGTQAVPPPVAAMLRDAGPQLVADGRLRIWSLDVDGTTIASSLVFAAGAELGYWLNGFDPDYAHLEPSKVSILHVIADAFASGARRLDLGEGDFAYKRRFSDGEETLARVLVVPASRRAPQIAVGLAPARARAFAAVHLAPETKDRVRGLAKGNLR